REVDDSLISRVIHANFGARKFSVRQRLFFDFNLLVGSPEIEMLQRRGIVQEKSDGQSRGRDQKSLWTGRVEKRHPGQNTDKPDRRRQSKPGHGKKDKDTGQASREIPGISVEWSGSKFNLAAHGLSEWDEDGRDQPEQDRSEGGSEKEITPVASERGSPNLDI